MIKLYTSKDSIPKSYKLVENIDVYFDGMILMVGANNSDNKELELIDKSTLDKSKSHVITPFGVTDLTHISTGCKAALLAKRVQNNVVLGIQECGNNVLRYMLNNFDNISLYCPYPRVLPYTENIIVVNNKKAYDYEDARSNWE